VPIRDLAARAGVLAGVWPPEGVVRTVVVELDQRRWCIYPDPESDDGWVAALTDDDGRPEPDTEVWLPRLAGESEPVTYWRRLLDATDWLPERWMGRRPPPLSRSTAGWLPSIVDLRMWLVGGACACCRSAGRSTSGFRSGGAVGWPGRRWWPVRCGEQLLPCGGPGQAAGRCSVMEQLALRVHVNAASCGPSHNQPRADLPSA
jgi:hypothetical protein